MHVAEVLEVRLRVRVRVMDVRDGDTGVTRLGQDGAGRPLERSGQIAADQHVLHQIAHLVSSSTYKLKSNKKNLKKKIHQLKSEIKRGRLRRREKNTTMRIILRYVICSCRIGAGNNIVHNGNIFYINATHSVFVSEFRVGNSSISF